MGGTGTTAQASNTFNFKEVIMVELDSQWNDIINFKYQNKEYEREPLPTINNKYQPPKEKQMISLFDIEIKKENN